MNSIVTIAIGPAKNFFAEHGAVSKGILALLCASVPRAKLTRAGVDGIFIPGRLNSSSLAKQCCKRPPGEISVQNIPHGPVYPAGFAV